MAEPRGLNRMSRSPTGVKRKEVKRKEYQPKSKKRRKLEYEVIDEDWGLAIGEDMTRFEKEEESRKQFLKAGNKNDMKVDTTIRQSTIRTWSVNELFCREIASKLIKTTSSRAVFMSSLQEELEGTSLTSIRPQVTEGQISRSPRNNPEKESFRGQDEQDEELLPDGWKTQKKKVLTTVKELFQARKLKKRLQEEDELEKEERMERRKRLEKGWKEKRNHFQNNRSAAEWLDDTVIEQTVANGHCNVMGRVSSLVMELVDQALEDGTTRASCGLETMTQPDEKQRNWQENIGRLERAERKRKFLMKEIETLWTAMEADGPGSENSLVAGKRKREPDRDEVGNLEELIKKLTEDLEKLELDRNTKQVSSFKFELDPPEGVKN